MDHLVIEGPCKLKGRVAVSSSKNATLPILAACLLNSKPTTLTKVPGLNDIRTFIRLLKDLGVQVDQGQNEEEFIFFTNELKQYEAPYDLVKTMRASILVLGPLLGRFKKARVSLPGGCAIGDRPIDLHLMALQKMNAQIEFNSGYVEATTTGLKGAEIHFPSPSVGATENIMMAAVLAEGTTTIKNAALEPEIVDLGNFLIAMGVSVEGHGTSTITIQGTTLEDLLPVNYQPIPDRIEAATLIMAGLITNSEIEIENVHLSHLDSVLNALISMGACFEVVEKNVLRVKKYERPLKGIKIETSPYPGYPTDAQAQLMALCTQASSASVIVENIFENRFMHVSELNRLGAKITLKGNAAFVEGPSLLRGAPVMCTDLRASSALVLSALVSEGITSVQRVYHLDRGYEHLEIKLKKLGAKIERVHE